MIKKIRLFFAKRKLENSLNHEEMLRESAEYMRKVIIPKLERDVMTLEVQIMADAFLKAKKNG